MSVLIVVFSIIGILIFIGFSALFSSLETAFICTEYLKIKKLRKNKPETYKYLNRLFSHPEHFLSTILVGNNLCLVVISSLATWLLLHFDIQSASFWVSAFLTPIIIIFAEMVPKSIGRSFKSQFFIYFIGSFRILSFVLRPIVLFMEFFPLKAIKFFIKKKKVSVNKDDIKLLTETLHNQGKIEKLEKEAIEDVLGFSKDRVKDVYVPLRKVVGLDYADDLVEILNKAKEFNLTRYPVFKNKKVIGYINLFDLFYKSFSSWREVIRSIPKVSIHQRIDDVFFFLKRRIENLALVLKGERSYGIVSTQDLMREITGSLIKR